MDDARIKQLTEEVLTQIGGGAEPASSSDLESRVAALERVVRSLQSSGTTPAPATTVVVTQSAAQPGHPALALLGPSGGGPGSPCILEPDKPCVGSGQCRSFGY